MRAVFSVCSVLAWAWPLSAQIAVTLHDLHNGQEILLRNNSSAALVAFVIYADKERALGRDRFVFYSDPLIDADAKPVASGEERAAVRRVLNGDLGFFKGSLLRQFREPVAAGGILDNGALIGDLGLSTRLILRRSNMLLAVDTVIETLENAGARNTSREQLIAQFRKISDSLNRSYLFPEQQVGHGLYESIIGKLTNLPEPALGVAFPPTEFVEKETAPLRRQQAALLASEPSLPVAALAGR